MIDIKKVIEEAQKEATEEKIVLAKEKIKEKLKQIDKASLVLNNLKRELDDLYHDISNSITA